VTEADYLENEVRELILMLNDQRHDGFVHEGLYKRLKRIRDLLDEEIKKYEG
jgi:hypothetical protein